MTETLASKFAQQTFSNGYELVDGVRMHAENPEHFLVPPDVIKRQIRVGHFVELRVDSPRFSVHEEQAQQCVCPCCEGQLAKPILRHTHPASLVTAPVQQMPSRGWGEDFWVRVEIQDSDFYAGTVDNRLCESRLHGLCYRDRIVFHQNHILAVHGVHRLEIVESMQLEDLQELAHWLRSNGNQGA